MNKLIYVVFFVSIISCNNQDKEGRVNPKLSDITETVYASIIIEPAISYSPQPTASGIINNILIQEGDTVKKGDKLFEISISPNIKNSLTTAELNLQEAKANYNGEDNLLLSIESEIQSVRQQLTLDSINFNRQAHLWAQNIGKKMDYEKADLAYKTTQSKLDILQQKKAQTLIKLRSDYQQALNLTKTRYSEFADYTIRSEINGVVYAIYKEVGDLINSQEKFGEIGSVNDFIIKMDIDEVDITKIELGDSVVISLDAYPDKSFIASVHKIYPKKQEATQTFEVESLFDPPLPKLYNGLSGEANILVDRRTNALIIPTDYLLPGNKVQTPDEIISVKIGVKNLEYVEILAGIDTTTTLLKPRE